MPKKFGFFFLALLILSFQNSSAQLGFCAGNSGDPIFTETFGAGTTNGPSLPAGTTTYIYTDTAPNDGFYTISSTTTYFGWHNTQDHTPGDSNGRAFIVNASITPGEFFKRTIDGLCENTSYEFSSWLINLLPATGCNGNGIPINVRFQIWDKTNSNLLATGDTGNIAGTSSPAWEQYGLVFKTEPGQTSVILKMINNGPGGCGNDLAIDDIVFKTCGDNITINNTANASEIVICEENAPITTTLTAAPDFSVYSTHAYQWQESNDSSNWVDIASATNQNYTTPMLNTTRYYRVKVAEDVINLANDKCNTVSDIFEIIIEKKPDAPISGGDTSFCVDSSGGVQVTVPTGVSVNWFDAPTGGNLLLGNSTSYKTSISGTYYAEAISPVANCSSQTRTAVSILYNDLPVVQDEQLTFCKNTSIDLSSGVSGVSHNWSTGEATPEIKVTQPGIYTVTVTNLNICSATKTITLSEIDSPVISEVTSNHREVNIATEKNGDYEYSLDDVNYQNSNVFSNLRGGLYTAYVRSLVGCGVVQLDFVHLVIPRFFTPNGDGINDDFAPEGIGLVNSYEISIFNRLGNLIASSNDSNFSWDGHFNNRELPTSDYWYSIQIDGKTFKGHFTLKR